MKIAIQGHPTRGKEVIQILESLGGKSRGDLTGRRFSQYYFVNCYGDIDLDLKINLLHHKLYTLEEFEQEFPFKVGDEVITTDGTIGIIDTFEPIEDHPYCIKANVGGFYWCVTSILKPYKKMERNITLTLDKAKEWYKKGGELKEIALQAFTEKELNALPKSWEEFCKQCNPVASWRYNIPIKYEALFKLEQLRDCWIQGWEPDWSDAKQAKCCICYYQGKFKISTLYETRCFLSFPTYKMAKEFLECFKDLIEQAGDLI